jgi:hypothetical protein
MDITTLAPWGEFLGGIAVVVSLIYLASQIRQNSKLLRVAASVAQGESEITQYKLGVDDPELVHIIERGVVDRDSLSDSDRRRFETWLGMSTAILQRNYFMAQDGALKQAIWQGDLRGNMEILHQPGSLGWWNENRGRFSDEFGEFLDGLIREGEAVG